MEAGQSGRRWRSNTTQLSLPQDGYYLPEFVSPNTYGLPAARAAAISASNEWMFFTVLEWVINDWTLPPG